MRSLFTYLCLCAMAVSVGLGQDSSGQLPLKVSPFTLAARLLTTVTPAPPDKPMAKCSVAVVYVDVIIDQNGNVVSAKAVSGWKEFHQSAVTAVKQFTYKPYVKNGATIPVETEVMIAYTSSGSAGPLFIPDDKGGVKGNKSVQLPPSCEASDHN